MIRLAQTYEDVRMVAEYMKQFEQATEYVKVDVDYTSGAYWDLIQDGIATFFIMEDDGKMIGGLGAVKYPDLHDGKMMAVESFWFVAPENRGKGMSLFNAFETWAINEGCKKLAMIHMVDSYPEILERLYVRKGYKLIEKHYVREV
jgi:GNAT superfamily N-acetyltransferase